jgi:hypothetical protein
MKLNEPYPVRERTSTQSLFHSLGEGIFLYIFFIVFEPFNISDWHDGDKYIKLLGFALITSLSTFINRELLPRLFPSFFKEEGWVVWKEIVSIILVLFTISLGNFIYGSFLFGWTFNFANVFGTFASVFLIAIFPLTFWVLMDYNQNMRKFNQNIIISHHTGDQPKKVQTIRLVAENEKDFIEFMEAELLFIESADNYSTVNLIKSGKIRKELLRSSLSRLDSQHHSDKLVRCHRSYIVNISKVEKVSGNAQGFKFHLSDTDQVVPVARKYSYLVEGLR